MRKKLGIIGGMGPEASSFFYARITARTMASRDQDHIDMVILSHATMPDRTEAILTGQKKPFLDAITEDARTLEKLGAANIAIPCNTSHYFLEDIQAATSVPIINMVEESVRYVLENHPDVKKIGIMGTDGTIQTGTYYRACEKAGVIACVPDEEAQRDVMSLIYDDIKGGKTGDRSKFERAYRNLMGQGCDAVILACTEISVFKEYYPVPVNCVDAMDVLVREAILRSGAAYRPDEEKNRRGVQR
ncbi:MAG TPA: amino acid racemase [Candidatus Bariatricus faecipullorum]|nr:amino acid racemase [Candidatus Bariatricus faecipullorum]